MCLCSWRDYGDHWVVLEKYRPSGRQAGSSRVSSYGFYLPLAEASPHHPVARHVESVLCCATATQSHTGSLIQLPSVRQWVQFSSGALVVTRLASSAGYYCPKVIENCVCLIKQLIMMIAGQKTDPKLCGSKNTTKRSWSTFQVLGTPSSRHPLLPPPPLLDIGWWCIFVQLERMLGDRVWKWRSPWKVMEQGENLYPFRIC